MTEANFQVEIVSPARPIFRGGARSVVAEGHDGELGIQPGHAPLVALLGTGIVRVAADGGAAESFAIHGGFLQVLGKKATLLVTQAVRRDEVDVAKAKASLAKTVEALQHPKDDADFQRLLDERRWWEAQIRLAG